MTKEEAIKYLESYLDEEIYNSKCRNAHKMAIEALEQESTQICKIPKDYIYDTETKDFFVYRHKYTGKEIHIEKPIPIYKLELLEQESKWISVNEKLPGKTCSCLVTIEDRNIYGEPYRIIYPNFVGYNGKTWHDIDGTVIPFEVIAWIQLPEPYKEESEG